jgi:hypothetical protein
MMMNREGGYAMSRLTDFILGIAAFIVISTAAEAADGCGRGWFYNGQRCAPQEEPGPRYYGPRARYHEAEPERRPRYYEPEPQPRYYEPEPQTRYYEPEPPVTGPEFRLDLGGREEPQYSPPNPAFKTWNNCPPNFTIQDGLCKPYKGR